MRARTQREVDGGGPGAFIALGPMFQTVAPIGPKHRCTGGDLKPVVADEEEVVRSRLRLVGESFRGDVPTEDFPKQFWWDACVYVQQRVSSALELDDIS